MHDVSKAEKVRHDSIHIGYTMKVAHDLYAPLDLNGYPFGDPTDKADAENLVVLFYTDPVRKKAHQASLKST